MSSGSIKISIGAQNSAALSALYSIPDTHVVYVGPIDCARHNCRMNYLYGRMSFLCPSDAELATGLTERLIYKCAEELIQRYEGKLKGIVFFSGCQTRLMDVDFARAIRHIRMKYGIAGAHFEESRFKRFDHITAGKMDMQASLFSMLQEGPGKKNGILILGGNQDLGEADRRLLCDSLDAEWIASSKEWKTFEDFERSRDAKICIVLSDGMIRAAECMKSRNDIPFVRVKPGYDVEQILEMYRSIGAELDREIDASSLIGEMERAVDQALYSLNGRPVTLDIRGNRAGYQLGHLMIDHGFNITELIVDEGRGRGGRNQRRMPPRRGMQPPPMPFWMGGISENEENHKKWLRENIEYLQITQAPSAQMFDIHRDMTKGEVIHGFCDGCAVEEPEDTIRTEWGFSAIISIMEKLIDEVEAEEYY